MKKGSYKVNEMIVDGDVIKIQLVGCETIIDKEDLDKVLITHWVNQSGYASGVINGKYVRLHQIVIPQKEGLEVDHINGDKLDNRKCNLRLVTHKQNMWNRNVRKDCKSGYRGVSWNKIRKCWYVRIKKDGKTYCYGTAKTKEDAAMKANVLMSKLYGDFAKMNI